jgi:probable F420-dependent oxidoreductase
MPEPKIKFGVILPNFGPQASRLGIVDTALAAESLGFDSVWLTDHLLLPKADAERFGNLFEAVSTLSYLAGVTNRIRLGISALVLPQRNPIEVARQMATLDVLSGGRTTLAAGVGWSAGEYANLGYDFTNRGKRMDEALKVLRTLWRGKQLVSFQGKYHNFEQAVFSPLPVQPGGPLLWVGGNSQKALWRAIQLADGWHPTGMSAEDLGATLGKMSQFIRGRPFAVCNRLHLSFGAQGSESGSLNGTPQAIVEQMNRYRAAGMNYALIDFDADSKAGRETAMRRFMREVAPAVNQ